MGQGTRTGRDVSDGTSHFTETQGPPVPDRTPVVSPLMEGPPLDRGPLVPVSVGGRSTLDRAGVWGVSITVE